MPEKTKRSIDKERGACYSQLAGIRQKVFLFYRRKKVQMADKIAVLIPCYNESKTVAKVIRDMRKALPEVCDLRI